MTPPMIADGEFALTAYDETEENYIEAYQYLVDTGMAWQLQGRVGREAMRLIKAGLVNTDVYKDEVQP